MQRRQTNLNARLIEIKLKDLWASGVRLTFTHLDQTVEVPRKTAGQARVKSVGLRAALTRLLAT